MINNVNNSEDADLARQTLAIVFTAYRPLTFAELAYLVGLTGSTGAARLQAVISDCHFLDVHAGDVHFVHQSALDFLESEHLIRRPLGHELIALRCIDLLIGSDHASFNKDSSTESDEAGKGLKSLPRGSEPALNPSAPYAARFFSLHVVNSEANDGVLFQRLLALSESRGMLDWIEYLAAASELRVISHAGEAITSTVAAKIMTASSHDRGLEQVRRWGENLVRLVERFSSHLRDSPESVRDLWGQVISQSPAVAPDSASFKQEPSLDEYMSDGESSVASLESADSLTSVSSSGTTPSSVAVDQRGAATLFLANQLAADPELQELYTVACVRTKQDKFIRNHMRLLRALYEDLKPQARGAMEGQVIGFLRSRRIQSNISRHIFQSFQQSSAMSIASLLDKRRSGVLDVNRWLGEFAEKTQDLTAAEVDVADDNSSDDAASDDSEGSVEDMAAPDELDVPNLSNMALFITSGSAFASYKDNLRQFLNPRDARPDAPQRKGTLLSRIEHWLQTRTHPLKPGYERVSFVCVSTQTLCKPCSRCSNMR